MRKIFKLLLAKSCWICGAPISSGTVCDSCNRGPE